MRSIILKNIVLLIVDSMNYSHMKLNPELTPFLNKIKSQGIYFESMYSQAPYTEAAVMNIYCGQNVLDNGGYLKRFKHTPKTIFEAMREKGYITYFNSFQPQCYASSLRRGVDCLFNNVGYDPGPLWSYRLYLYADLFKNGNISENDYLNLIDILDDNFKEWILFEKQLIEKNIELDMIQYNSIAHNPVAVLERIETEFQDYQKDKKAYIQALLAEGKNHALFQIPGFNQDNKIKDKNVIPVIQNLARPTFKRIYKTHKKLNRKMILKALRGPCRKLIGVIKHPSMNSLKTFGKSGLLFLNTIKDLDLFERISDGYENFKNAPSIKTHIDHYINWETKRDQLKPSFACIHVDDIHNPEVFFTYDTENIELVKTEMDDANKVLDGISSEYYGNISHDLSLRYMDRKIEYFFDQLKENHLFDNTVVVICADHGFSFSGNPMRDTFVTNMYLENYNIPCIVWGTEYSGERDMLCSSKDIPSMIAFLADGIVPNEFSGKNPLIEQEPYSELFIEYCGGGCPEINYRKLKIACFDKKYFLATEEELNTLITIDNVSELYELDLDPLQLTNKNQKKVRCNTDYYIEMINKRKEEIKYSNRMKQ